ncbi:hypothetical protein ACWDUM_23250 [Rhodococcus sp. NPDC003322]
MLITTQLLQGPGGAAAGYGLPMLTAALCQIPASIVLIAVAPASASVTGRFGARTTLPIGATFLTAGYCLHAVAEKPLWGVIAALSITDVGTAFCYSTLPLLTLAVVPPQHLASENGVNYLLRTTGSTLCSATAATILAAFALDGSEKAMSWSGFTVAYLVCAACAVVVFAVSTRLPRHPVSRDR